MTHLYLPFLYGDVVNALAAEVAARRQVSLLIAGGRGLGKTWILESLADTLTNRFDISVHLAEGRQVARDSPLGSEFDEIDVDTLLIDDIDALLGVTTHESFDDIHPRLEWIRRVLHAQAAGQPQGKQIVATSTSELIELPQEYACTADDDARRRAIWSVCFHQFQRAAAVNPWPTDWRNRIQQAITACAKDYSVEQLDTVSQAIIEVTGGHPSLVEDSLALLMGNSQNSGHPALLANTGNHSVAETAHTLAYHLRQYGNGVHFIRRALNALNSLEGKAGKAAAVWLQHLARSSSPAMWKQIPEGVKHLLARHGLAFVEFSNDTATWQVAGQLVKQVITEQITPMPSAHGSPPAAIESIERTPGLEPRVDTGKSDATVVQNRHPTQARASDVHPARAESPDAASYVTVTGSGVKILPDEHLGARLGKMRYPSPEGIKTVVLKDGMWQLLWVLSKHRGQVLSYEAIVNDPDTDFTSEKQVRNAKTRLRMKLLEDKLPEIVETVYGQGIRLRE